MSGSVNKLRIIFNRRWQHEKKNQNERHPCFIVEINDNINFNINFNCQKNSHIFYP